MAGRVRGSRRTASLIALATAALLGSGLAAAQADRGAGMGQGFGPGGPGAGAMQQPGMGMGMGSGLGYGACWDWMRGGFEGGFGDPRTPLWELELEGDKLAEMRKLRRAYREFEAHVGVELAEMRDDMAELMAVEQPDPDAIEELHGRMSELQGELLAERVRMRNEMIGLLDAEQRERFREEFGPRR
ncbi:Spy/CpxP family protein refolding chaperone [Halorhodospira halophila]|uniref:Spy/CpxP family protein refolding chaperone n=1 Tax=Halorhodospira halophila TaxID=1053 RepID=UPI001912C3EF|nr:Spy/CpxP family protein refolding chaperone [Halorhodospira halophila]